VDISFILVDRAVAFEGAKWYWIWPQLGKLQLQKRWWPEPETFYSLVFMRLETSSSHTPMC